jgi:hypothetical protein
VEIGFTLSSEEQGPKELVHLARAAEEAGFSFATISDHFHPWTSQQGNSPFVWPVLGAIAEATSRIRLLVRHPVPERETAPTEEREMLGTSYPSLFLVRYRSGRGNRRRRRPCRKSR